MAASSRRLWTTFVAGGLAFGCALIMDDLPPPAEPEGAIAGAQAGGAASGGDGAGAAVGQAASAGSSAGGAAGAAGREGEAGASPSSCAEPCDCDDDGVFARGACGGNDCDDADADAWPGQTEYFFDERAGGGWDYDCSGAIEREHDAVDCSGIPSCDTMVQGFLVVEPECGTRQDWGKCEAPSLVCQPSKISTEPVRCH